MTADEVRSLMRYGNHRPSPSLPSAAFSPSRTGGGYSGNEDGSRRKADGRPYLPRDSRDYSAGEGGAEGHDGCSLKRREHHHVHGSGYHANGMINGQKRPHNHQSNGFRSSVMGRIDAADRRGTTLKRRRDFCEVIEKGSSDAVASHLSSKKNSGIASNVRFKHGSSGVGSGLGGTRESSQEKSKVVKNGVLSHPPMRNTRKIAELVPANMTERQQLAFLLRQTRDDARRKRLRLAAAAKQARRSGSDNEDSDSADDDGEDPDEDDEDDGEDGEEEDEGEASGSGSDAESGRLERGGNTGAVGHTARMSSEGAHKGAASADQYDIEHEKDTDRQPEGSRGRERDRALTTEDSGRSPSPIGGNGLIRRKRSSPVSSSNGRLKYGTGVSANGSRQSPSPGHSDSFEGSRAGRCKEGGDLVSTKVRETKDEAKDTAGKPACADGKREATPEVRGSGGEDGRAGEKIGSAMDKPEGYGEWSPRKQRAWDNLIEDPNAFYENYVPPGVTMAKGDWTEAERLLFVKLLSEHPAGEKWGLFSMHLPSRTGRQCRELFQELVNDGVLDSLACFPEEEQKRLREVESSKVVATACLEGAGRRREVSEESNPLPEQSSPLKASPAEARVEIAVGSAKSAALSRDEVEEDGKSRAPSQPSRFNRTLVVDDDRLSGEEARIDEEGEITKGREGGCLSDPLGSREHESEVLQCAGAEASCKAASSTSAISIEAVTNDDGIECSPLSPGPLDDMVGMNVPSCTTPPGSAMSNRALDGSETVDVHEAESSRKEGWNPSEGRSHAAAGMVASTADDAGVPRVESVTTEAIDRLPVLEDAVAIASQKGTSDSPLSASTCEPVAEPVSLGRHLATIVEGEGTRETEGEVKVPIASAEVAAQQEDASVHKTCASTVQDFGDELPRLSASDEVQPATASCPVEKSENSRDQLLHAVVTDIRAVAKPDDSPPSDDDGTAVHSSRGERVEAETSCSGRASHGAAARDEAGEMETDAQSPAFFKSLKSSATAERSSILSTDGCHGHVQEQLSGTPEAIAGSPRALQLMCEETLTGVDYPPAPPPMTELLNHAGLREARVLKSEELEGMLLQKGGVLATNVGCFDDLLMATPAVKQERESDSPSGPPLDAKAPTSRDTDPVGSHCTSDASSSDAETSGPATRSGSDGARQTRPPKIKRCLSPQYDGVDLSWGETRKERSGKRRRRQGSFSFVPTESLLAQNGCVSETTAPALSPDSWRETSERVSPVASPIEEQPSSQGLIDGQENCTTVQDPDSMLPATTFIESPSSPPTAPQVNEREPEETTLPVIANDAPADESGALEDKSPTLVKEESSSRDAQTEKPKRHPPLPRLTGLHRELQALNVSKASEPNGGVSPGTRRAGTHRRRVPTSAERPSQQDTSEQRPLFAAFARLAAADGVAGPSTDAIHPAKAGSLDFSRFAWKPSKTVVSPSTPGAMYAPKKMFAFAAAATAAVPGAVNVDDAYNALKEERQLLCQQIAVEYQRLDRCFRDHLERVQRRCGFGKDESDCDDNDGPNDAALFDGGCEQLSKSVLIAQGDGGWRTAAEGPLLGAVNPKPITRRSLLNKYERLKSELIKRQTMHISALEARHRWLASGGPLAAAAKRASAEVPISCEYPYSFKDAVPPVTASPSRVPTPLRTGGGSGSLEDAAYGVEKEKPRAKVEGLSRVDKQIPRRPTVGWQQADVGN